MSSVSGLNNDPTTRLFNLDLAPASQAQDASEPVSPFSQGSPSRGLFSADGFDSGGFGGAEGTGGENLFGSDTVDPGNGGEGDPLLQEFVKLLSDLAELTGAKEASASKAAPKKQAPADGAPATAQAEKQPAGQHPPAAVATDGAQPTKGSGAPSDAKAFLSQGLYSQDQVYPEISHAAPGLGEKNKALWDTAKARGGSDEEAAILVAQQMQEGGNDPTKSGGAANFGPLNLNGDMLTKSGGVQAQDLAKLNENSNGKYTQAALNANVDAALTAMRSLRTQGYLDYTRGGSSGFEHPTERQPFQGSATADDDTRRFGRNISNVANRLLVQMREDPASIGRDWRQAANIPYV